jgi:mannose-6-phosphate isomerase-like protein (cupin superfamily)
MTTMPAPHLPSPDRPDALWSLGCLFIRKSTSDDLEVIEGLVPPGYSPPMHRHDSAIESFYVLEGRVRFVVGDEDVVQGPGGFTLVPRSAPHSFEVLGDEPARVLDIITPAALWEFFAECGRPAPQLRLPDTIDIPEDLAEIVARYDGAVVGPPLNRPAIRLEAQAG